MKKVFLKTLGILLLCISSSAYGALSVSITGGGETYSGNSVTLKAEVSGAVGAISYYWFESEDNSSWGQPISSASSYTISYTNTGNYSFKRYYRVVVQNNNSGSEAFTSVTWYPQLAVSLSSSGINTYSGGIVNIWVRESGGSGAYSYQWQVSSNNSSWSNVPDYGSIPPESGRYGIYFATNTNTGSSDLVKYYRVQVTSVGQTVTSPTLQVTWRPALKAGSISGGNIPVADGCTTALTANPTGGNGNYTYQWQESSDNSSWANTDNVNGTSRTCSFRTYNSGSTNITKYYRVKITNDNQTETSASVYLTVKPKLIAGTISQTRTNVISGNSVTLTANPSGGLNNNGDYSYLWYESDDGSTWKSTTQGPTSNRSITVTNTVSGGVLEKYYYVLVIGTCSGESSQPVSVAWYPDFTAQITSGGGTTTYSGDAVYLAEKNNYGNYREESWQWQESSDNSTWSNVPNYGNGSDPTQTGTFYCYHAVNTNTGTSNLVKYYRVVVTKCGVTKTASSVTVTWRPSLKVSISWRHDNPNGSSVQLTANPSGGNGSYTYQWQESSNGSSWSDIANAKSQTYTTSGYNNQTKYYRVTVSGDNQTVTSSQAEVRWWPPVNIGPISGGGKITNSGGSVNLSINPSGGDGLYTYQWQVSDNNSSWSNVASNGTSSTYAASNTNSGSTNLTKYYRVQVGCSTDPAQYTSSVMVTWRPALVAGSITGGGTYGYGKQATLTANPLGGNGSYTYQWQESSNNSSWSNISYATNRTYSASGSNQTKYYRVVITGDNQTVTSTSTSVTWHAQLVIGGINCNWTETYSGGVIPFWVAPSGGDGTYTYQWQESEDNSSWSNTTFTGNDCMPIKTNLGSDLIGWYYRVVVSSGGQTATSGHVFLVWRPALVAGDITGGNVTTNSNNSITLTANPSGGNDTYTYIWKQSYDGTSWSIISGETSKTCSVSGSDETKFYKVEVGGDHQTQESSAVSITWGAALSAGGITGATTTYSGGNVTLTAHPSGGLDNNYAYQWQVYDNSTWNNLSGANDQTCIVSTANTGNTDLSRIYRVQVTNNGITANSASVVVVWRPALVAGTIGGGGSYCYGASEVLLTANPSGGDGNYAYQWQVSEDNVVWTDIPGATFNSLAETGSNETDDPITMYYRVVISGDHQNSASEVASVTRRPSLKISNIQSVGNSIVYGGDDVNLTVTASGGDGTYSYQWYRRDAESDWTPVGANSSSFSDSFENNTNSSINYQYKVVVSSDSQEKTSAEFQCSWVASMRIDGLLYAPKVSYGVTSSIHVLVANGSGIYDYQWQIFVNGEWQNIPDYDNPIYTFAITEACDYRCVVTDSLYPNKSVTTDVASIDVWPDLIPGTTPTTSYTVDNDSITIGGGIPSGGNGTYHYRWEKRTGNGEFVPMPDTTPTIDVLPDCNTTYRRYDISGDQEKLAFEIQVNVPLKSGAIGVDGLAEFYYAGQQLPILENKTEASGGNVGGSASYQWYSKGESDNDFTPIDGATYADYRPAGLSETTSFYRAIVDGDDVQNSNVIELNIRIPVIELANLKERYCRDDAVSISVSGVENGVYVWFDGSGNQIGEGAELKLESISESTTLTLETYINTDELLNEKSVALTVVDMTPDFVPDRYIVDAGDVVHFTNNGSDYTQCEWDFGDGADGSFESEPWHYYNYGGTFDVKLRLTSSEGCQVEIAKAGAITVNEAVSTDVEADKAGSVSVYPNPVTDWLTVEADGEFVVTITNNLGSVVFKSTASTNLRIDMTNYPEGIYTVGVVDGAGNAHFEQIVK